MGENFKLLIGHVWCNENEIIKDLMNEFLNWYWIYEEFVNLNKKRIWKVVHDMQFQAFFLPFKLNFCKL
jgi:hypothetical protein